jgi:hypothetical protein
MDFVQGTLITHFEKRSTKKRCRIAFLSWGKPETQINVICWKGRAGAGSGRNGGLGWFDRLVRW